jgi:glycosyltransferase involved in cell wall biosynthesis
METSMIKQRRENNFLTWEEKALIDWIPGIKIKEINGIEWWNPLVIEKNVVNILIDSYNCYPIIFLKRAKSITWCWDVCPLFMSYHSFIGNIRLKINYNGMRKSDRIVTSSENTKRDIIKYLKYPAEKINVVPAGIEKKIFRPLKNKPKLRNQIIKKYGIFPNEKIILYIGSEQPRKNLPTLFNALSELKKKGIKFKLIKIGTYSEKLVKNLNIKENVLNMGLLDREKDLHLFYNIADIFVFPSYYEGFGLPLLEAMACGCPVVTTNCSSIPEVVGDAAIKINDPFDYHTLSGKIKEVLENDGLRQDMIRMGIRQAAKFSWEKYADEVYKVCEEVWNEK